MVTKITVVITVFYTIITLEIEQLKYNLSGLKLYYIHTPTNFIHYKQEAELIVDFLRA